jgi:hypothetical protein
MLRLLLFIVFMALLAPLFLNWPGGGNPLAPSVEGQFYKCSSPGAAQAKQLIEDMALIAADGSTRDTLKKAVALHEDSIASGGDRTCLSFRGEQISLRSAKHREGGFDLTSDIAKGYRKTDFVFVSEAEISDCKALL